VHEAVMVAIPCYTTRGALELLQWTGAPIGPASHLWAVRLLWYTYFSVGGMSDSTKRFANDLHYVDRIPLTMSNAKH
jgi:hypothetical protein